MKDVSVGGKPADNYHLCNTELNHLVSLLPLLCSLFGASAYGDKDNSLKGAMVSYLPSAKQKMKTPSNQHYLLNASYSPQDSEKQNRAKRRWSFQTPVCWTSTHSK